MSETESVYKQESDSDSTIEGNVPQRPHRGGKGGKPLLGSHACLQSENEDSEEEVERNTKTVEKA